MVNAPQASSSSSSSSSKSLLHVNFWHKWSFNPLNPHDASEQHFVILKNDLTS